MDFEAALQMKPENGLYWLNSTLSRDRLEEIARKSHDNFYYIDGEHVTDHWSFFDALTEAYEWPVPGGGNWDAIFDVITEPRYYEPQNKGIIVFDQCHHLAKADAGGIRREFADPSVYWGIGKPSPLIPLPSVQTGEKACDEGVAKFTITAQGAETCLNNLTPS